MKEYIYEKSTVDQIDGPVKRNGCNDDQVVSAFINSRTKKGFRLEHFTITPGVGPMRPTYHFLWSKEE